MNQNNQLFYINLNYFYYKKPNANILFLNNSKSQIPHSNSRGVLFFTLNLKYVLLENELGFYVYI